MSFTISQLILYWLMQEFISAHSSSNKFWGNVVCMKMGAWLEQYDTHVPWPSLAPNVLPKFSWSTYIYIYIASEVNIYIMCVRKVVYGCLILSAKSATSFPSVNNSSKFSSCMIEATMTSNASIILPEEDKHVHLCTLPVQLHSWCQLITL